VAEPGGWEAGRGARCRVGRRGREGLTGGGWGGAGGGGLLGVGGSVDWLCGEEGGAGLGAARGAPGGVAAGGGVSERAYARVEGYLGRTGLGRASGGGG